MTIPPIFRGPQRSAVRERRDAPAGQGFAVAAGGLGAAEGAAAMPSVSGDAAVSPAALLALQAAAGDGAAGGARGFSVAETAFDRLKMLQVALLDARALTAEEQRELAATARALQQIDGTAAQLGLALATRIRVELAKRAAQSQLGTDTTTALPAPG